MNPPTILYERDIDSSQLSGRVVAVIGYGSQGSAQARNLRDAGINVIVGQRPGGPNYQLALDHGFQPLSAAEATRRADIVHLLLPDQFQGQVYAAEIAGHLAPGKALAFSHGFSIHYGTIQPPAGVDVYLVAPKGPGPRVRSAYEAGGGVPALVAVHQDATGNARRLALAHASALGAGRAGILETTFREETETDLFGEQAVLCGGVAALVRAAYDTLVQAGYAPEMAYIECIQELKQTVDLIYAGGVNHMRARISDTAEFGDYTRGPRIVTEATHAEMKRILEEIQNGKFAREWMEQAMTGSAGYQATRAEQKSHASESTGRAVREGMKWPPSV